MSLPTWSDRGVGPHDNATSSMLSETTIRIRDPRVFDGHDDLVAVYGGVVIDSRFLFKLVRDVELEVIADEKARDLLWQISEGRFEY